MAIVTNVKSRLQLYMIYQKILKPIFFLFEPEFIHDRFVALGELLGRFSITRRIVRSFCLFEDPSLAVEVNGLKFQNPVGLAAGFDKDTRLTRIIPEVGFGFMEVGAVTELPFGGNAGRRLLRLPKDKALVVYYGLKNIGSEAIYEKASKLTFTIPTGLNIAKTNHADIKGEKAVEDYVNTYRLLSPYFAYSAINISCPNALDGSMFQDNPILLDKLLSDLSNEKKSSPVFLKISNHISDSAVDQVIAVVERYTFVDGFIIANLSKDRSNLNLQSPKELLDLLPNGGISGKPIQEKSDHLIRHVYSKIKGKYTIIGVGGIFTAEDAYRKIKAGASLVQLMTGLIYEGPLVIKKINKELARIVKRDGYKNISEAVGAGVN